MSDTHAVHYHVAVSSVAGHYFHVSQTIYQPTPQGQKLTLPAWIPGSYMIRDFAKNIVSIQAYDSDNNRLDIEKLDKQSWQVAATAGPLRVETLIYAFDLSVRSAFISDEYAFFNGTSVFLQAVGVDGSISVDITIPTEKALTWQIATALKQTSSNDITKQFSAKDYTQLIDQPVVIGNLTAHQFELEGVTFEFVLAGDNLADVPRICQDLKKICLHHLHLFSPPCPVDRYVFITLLCENGFGGLEHMDSTVLQYARHALPSEHEKGKVSDEYRTFLSLCSHELFHTWHVKRTKPQAFIDLQLSAEVYSEQLWIYEGFTSYVDDISLLRTKLIDENSYLELLGQTLTRLARNPGNTKQTVTESSFDAWTRFYQQDASAANNIVSYYAKGCEIALCLDLKMRLGSQHKYTIFDLIDKLWQEFGSQSIGTQNNSIQYLLDKHFDLDLDAFLQDALYSTKALPTDILLREFGVKLINRPRNNGSDKGGKPADDHLKVDFGAMTSAQPTGVKITQVIENSASYIAGLQVGDIVIAIDNWQIQQQNLHAILDKQAFNKIVPVHLLREGKLTELKLSIQPAKRDTVYLQIIDEQKAHAWLGQSE